MNTAPTAPLPESEGSGEPLPLRNGTGEFAVEPLLVPPPLSPQQVEKILKAIDAVKEAKEALGSLAWPLVKWAFGKVIEGLRAIPIAPLTPPLGTQEPSTLPPTTP